MRKFTLICMVLFLSILTANAQKSCTDLNGYVNSKDKDSVVSSYYDLSSGLVEKAAQTYYYSVPGLVTGVRIYGNYAHTQGGVPLKVGLYNVDANDRPTSLITYVNTTWWWFNNNTGFINVSFASDGVWVNSKFAVTVEIGLGFPWGNSFKLRYTGDGEGKGEDLASLAGTSTGLNWASAKNNFNKDGDFYIVPKMTHFISSQFTVNSACVSTNSNVNFSNNSLMTKDSMFNLIAKTGGNNSYHFSTWNFGDNSTLSYAESPSHTYSTPGVYTVSLVSTFKGWGFTVTDTFSTKISVGLSIAPNPVVNATCNGSLNGSVTAVGTGGKSPYLFSLNGINYQPSATFSGLGAGNYPLFVKDNLGCVSSTTFIVGQSTAISVSTATTNASCGNANGAILASATGGSGILMYQLNNGAFQISGSFTGIRGGAYHVTVKDTNNCSAISLVLVNDIGSPTWSSISHSNITCNGGNNGAISILATGGTGALRYSIDGGINFRSSGYFDTLSVGVYPLLAIDASGCKILSSMVISQPPPLSITTTSSPVLCNGGNSGRIFITSAIGGTGVLSFSINGVNYQSGTTFQSLPAGIYTVFVKDVVGCIASTLCNISQPTTLTASAVTTAVTCNGSNDGSITVTGSGGAGNYTYSIDGINFHGSQSFSNLAAGTYIVTVKDANACSYNFSTTITQPSLISAVVTTTNSTCGNSNGGILVVASGGSGLGFQYSIDGTNFNSTGSFTPMARGTYYILIKDTNNCQRVVVAVVTDSNGPAITSISHTNVSCNGSNDGSITINTVTGGTGSLTYSINGTIWQASTIFTGLFAGTYSVFVKDAAGCTGTTSTIVTEPNAFAITTTVTNVACFGGNSGSASIFAAGGSGTLAYSIEGLFPFQSSNVFSSLYVGSYTVTVRDAAGCRSTKEFSVSQPTDILINTGVLNVSCGGAQNGAIYFASIGGSGTHRYSLTGTNYQLGYSFTGLSGGDYTLYVKDGNNCVKTVHVMLYEPSIISVNASVSDVSCSGGNNGVIDITANGGTKPYVYRWSNGATTEDVFNLTAGTYILNILDANGCTFSHTYNISQPTNPIIINGVANNASSSNATNGSINITVTGGVTPYNYKWSNNSPDKDIMGLVPGVYTVMVKDAKNCSASSTFVVGFSTGVNAISGKENSITVYPNPADNFINVETNGSAKIDVIRVVNLLGQIIYSAEPKDGKSTINTTNMKNGVYFIQAVINGQLITRKVEIVR